MKNYLILLILLRNEMGSTSRWSRRTFEEPVRILNLLLKDPFESMRARAYFSPEGRLCKKRLISFEHNRGSFGRSSLSLTEKSIREIFGQPKLKKGDEDGMWHHFGTGTRRRDGENFRVPKITLEQVVLPSNVKEDILRCLSQVHNEKTLFKSWGFSEVIKYGKGVTMLFAGPPGTGKTITAQAVANHLRKKLFVVNTAQIKSMWHGGTDKNIVATFHEAKEKNSVLFFDEADALFYSRMGSTRHSIDVLYNQIINLMLQEIEKFDGVVILATNHSKGMDEALERRITLKVEFELPDTGLRAKIWRTLIPASAPLAEDVDFHALAIEFEFAGGHIKNAVLNAARFAVSRGEGAVITMQDLHESALGELKGKSLFGKKNNGKVGFRKAGTS